MGQPLTATALANLVPTYICEGSGAGVSSCFALGAPLREASSR
jgi:hypothetical protein